MSGLLRLLPAFLCLFLLLCGCTASRKDLEEKLEEIAARDLEDILKEMKAKRLTAQLTPSPRYRVKELTEFEGDSARVYQAMATVLFFYFQGIDLCQERKYRFNTSGRFWDRYEVRLRHIPREAAGTPPP